MGGGTCFRLFIGRLLSHLRNTHMCPINLVLRIAEIRSAGLLLVSSMCSVLPIEPLRGIGIGANVCPFSLFQAVCPQPPFIRCTLAKDAHVRTQAVLLATQSASDAGSRAASARQATTLPLAWRCRFASFADQPAV